MARRAFSVFVMFGVYGHPVTLLNGAARLKKYFFLASMLLLLARLINRQDVVFDE